MTRLARAGVRARKRSEDQPLGTLPERARLLHIGLMKTGTTAVQRAASRRRKALLRHGVRYPGTSYNHRQAALALMNAPSRGASTSRDHGAWADLMREVNDDPNRRIWVSNEFICGADEATAQRFLDDLGERVHVVVTLRSVGSVLPSLWQQYVKTGWTADFPSFLRSALADRPDPSELPPYHHRNDQSAVVSRWSSLVGPDRVTVVIVDKFEPRRAQAAFEAMLGLPPRLLDLPEGRGSAANRSLSAEEVSLFLQINRALPADAVTRDEIVRILEGGALARVLDERCSPSSDHRLVLPPWARDSAAELGRRYATAIAETGVRVVGDLAELSRVPDSPGTWEVCDQVPVDLAAQAVIGAMSAGLHRGSHFGRVMPEPVRDGQRRTARRALSSAVRRVTRGLARRARSTPPSQDVR